uniref:AraC family transcriptional regulator n=1 Tax=Thermosporothrix sp. COM3 TaxID=2490863 RepID=A0A455SRG8_9CHLR|nr:AraC family transcriptional regulator [Thermosporothrix sp. COM3]
MAHMIEIPQRRRGRQIAEELHRSTIEQVILTMKNRLHEPLSLDEMADMACLSPYYFNRLFHRHIGVPPIEFLAAWRLEQAKRLLLTTDLSVTDICFEVGYVGLGSFITRFTQAVGVSPGNLRKIMQAEKFARPEIPDEEGRRIMLPGLHGTILAPDTQKRITHVGLFTKPIPQARPVRCTVADAYGSFLIDDIPPGTYYVLAASLPETANPAYFVLPGEQLLVGMAGPITVRPGELVQGISLFLRATQVTDPPLLLALPVMRA